MRANRGTALLTGALTVLAVGTGPASADWSGTYIGLNAGYGFSGNEATGEGIDAFPIILLTHPSIYGLRNPELNSNGVIGGGQIGHRWQSDHIVFGIEGDALLSAIVGSDTVCQGNPEDCSNDTRYSARQDLDWLATVRGNVGYAFSDDWLLYVTAGLAAGGLDLRANLDNAFSSPGADDWPYSDKVTRLGWALGIGGEHAMSDSVSIFAQYLHVDLGSEKSGVIEGSAAAAPERLRYQVDNAFDIVRAGVNISF